MAGAAARAACCRLCAVPFLTGPSVTADFPSSLSGDGLRSLFWLWLTVRLVSHSAAPALAVGTPVPTSHSTVPGMPAVTRSHASQALRVGGRLGAVHSQHPERSPLGWKGLVGCVGGRGWGPSSRETQHSGCRGPLLTVLGRWGPPPLRCHIRGCRGWGVLGRCPCQDSSSCARARCQEPGSSGHAGHPARRAAGKEGDSGHLSQSPLQVPREAAAQLLCSARAFPGGPACERPRSLRAVWTGPFHVPGQGWPQQSGDGAPERIGGWG